MSIKIKSNKRTQRRAVIPFDGEEQFVVPKKGGFGQPDMEGYVMVAGSSTIATSDNPIESPSSSGVSTSTSLPVLSTDTPPRSTSTSTSGSTTLEGGNAPTQAEIDCTTSGGIYSNGACSCPSGTALVRGKCIAITQADMPPPVAQTDCVNSGGTYANNVCTCPSGFSLVNSKCTANVVNLPDLPDFSTMDCANLNIWKDKINNILATSRLVPEVISAYNNALATINATITNKCSTSGGGAIIVAPIGGGGIGGGGFGGGGGGFGEEPQPIEAIEEKKGSNLWIILLLAGVGLYFLTKKSKQ